MRQIKFRAIDQFSDDFIYAPAFFIDTDNNQGYLIWGTDNYHCVKKETVGEFAGLLDKHGAEIYEGDLVKYGDDEPLEVMFENQMFCVRNVGSKHATPLKIMGSFNKWNKIGNIHQP